MSTQPPEDHGPPEFIDVDWQKLKKEKEPDNVIYLADGRTPPSAISDQRVASLLWFYTPGPTDNITTSAERVGLRWRYGMHDDLYREVKRAGAHWSGRLWLLDRAAAEPILEGIRARADLHLSPYRRRSDLQGLTVELTAVGHKHWRLDWDLEDQQARQAIPGIMTVLSHYHIRAQCLPAHRMQIFALLTMDLTRIFYRALRHMGVCVTIRRLRRSQRCELPELPVNVDVNPWLSG